MTATAQPTPEAVQTTIGRTTDDDAILRPPIGRPELLGVGAILVLAALLRFWALPGRGAWDADQGHEMLTLLHLVRDGTIPLLGPSASSGGLHHGPLYYYLLAPVAFLSGADPTAIVAEIALLGVSAVGVTWFLARSIAGPVAGFAAALIMAVSASAIDQSTFIWNPNLIALSSSITLAAAWRARATAHPVWWLLAAFGLLVTMHCHVLGIALLPPIVYLWLTTRRATAVGSERRSYDRYGVGCLVVIAVGYLPLLVHELGHDFAETRAAVAFVESTGSVVAISLPARMVFVGLRILAWPLTGLLLEGLVIGVVAGVAVASGLAWRTRALDRTERGAARWLALTLLFGWVVLTFGVSGLATVTALGVDHYHAFLDPVVLVALGLGSAAVWRLGRTERDRRGLRGGLVVALGILVVWNVLNWPPRVATDGGWPAAEAAAERIQATVAGRPIQFIGLPVFKSTEAIGFPLERAGLSVLEGLPPTPAEGSSPAPAHDPRAAVVIVCDSLFVHDCDGPAEEAALGVPGAWPVKLTLADRWSAAPGRTVSVYLPAG